MRVTNSMIAGRVTYNTQNSISRFLELQTQMSTGKRINKPSDDPLGITRDLDYRNELAKNKQYQDNIGQAQSWYTTNDGVINSIYEFVSEAKVEAIRSANDGSNDESTRKLIASGIRDSIRGLLDKGNTQHEGRYIYSGFRTDSPAFNEHPNGMTFEGDTGSIKYKIDSSADIGVNMNGADLLLKPLLTLGEGFDLDVAINGSTQLSDLHNGDGINQVPGFIQLRDINLGITATFDLNAETTIDEVITQINNDLVINGINNLTVRIADDNTSLLFETTQNGLISGVTPLDNINSGAGVDMTSGLIRVTNDAGVDINVDLSSAVTVDDVMTQFNSQLAAAGIWNVNMSINAAGTGFEINDTNGIPLNLAIEDLENNINLAEQLGIVGNIEPTLIGGDLAPQVHFAVEELGGTTAEDLGLLGEFHGNHVGENLDAQLLPTSNLSDLNNGLGITTGEMVLWQGGSMATVDLDNPSIVTVQDMLDAFNNSGLDITASLNSDNRGIQVVNNDPYSSFTIEDVSGNSVARDLGIYGSSDLIGSFYVLANAMESKDSDGALEKIGSLLDNFDLGIDHITTSRGINGSKGQRLESTLYRLYSQEFMFTSRLSELEDADLTQVITDLSIFENNYQAALMASAKIIQPSLLNFLR